MPTSIAQTLFETHPVLLVYMYVYIYIYMYIYMASYYRLHATVHLPIGRSGQDLKIPIASVNEVSDMRSECLGLFEIRSP